MTETLKKAINVLLEKEKNGGGFLDSMRLVKSNLSPAEWKELKEMTLFGIARSITLEDVILLADKTE